MIIIGDQQVVSSTVLGLSKTIIETAVLVA